MSRAFGGPCLLTRPGCHLCDAFFDQWRAAFPGVDLPRRNIDGDPELVRRYGTRIPVLLDAAGEVVCEAFFDHDACARVAVT